MEYLSKECYDSLQAELHELIATHLPKAQRELSEARDKGDLSENFEYHAAKRELGRLVRLIRYKQRVLQYSRVMDTSNLTCDTVGIFRRVAITNLNNGQKMEYTFVNPHEADLKSAKLSVKSPIAQALLGKPAGAEVEVKVPAGTLRLRIDSISV